MTDRDPGGLYAPNDICTKTGRRVLDVLREKHPDACIPEENAFDHYANSADVLDEAMPIACYEEQISLRAAHLCGGAGPCGVDGTMLKEWLLRHAYKFGELVGGIRSGQSRCSYSSVDSR